MAVAYTRPFHPLDLASRAAAVFSLGEMIDQLRHEEVSHGASRNALTLVHDENLTAVLTVARQGAECGDHYSQEPTVFVMLEGELAIASASDGGITYLPNGSAGALARDVRHKLSATTDCAYLMVMGRHSKAERSAAVQRPAITGKTPTERSAQSIRQVTSSEAEADAIEDLVHQVMQRIDAAPAARRDELRAYASDLLAADNYSACAQADELQRPRRFAPLNFAAEAFLLALAGVIFLFFLPPVAAVLILLAILIAVGGVLRVLVARGVSVGRRLLPLDAWRAHHRSAH